MNPVHPTYESPGCSFDREMRADSSELDATLGGLRRDCIPKQSPRYLARGVPPPPTPQPAAGTGVPPAGDAVGSALAILVSKLAGPEQQAQLEVLLQVLT